MTDNQASNGPTRDGRRITLREVQEDWRVLDAPDFEMPEGVRLISHEQFTSVPGLIVDFIPPSSAVLTLRFFSPLFNLAYAFQLLARCCSRTVLLVNGGGVLWLGVGVLNRLLFGNRRQVICWDVFIEVEAQWKQCLFRYATGGMALSVLWSRQQVSPHASFLNLPEDRFVFIPYKANHSKGVRYDFPDGNYIFAGGNGKRDYACLTEAVKDTGIPVIISATDPAVRGAIEKLPNVMVLAAHEPAFAQLQAASRFVVVPMVHTGLKGGGEANFCNAMWHGKPVIAADSIAAEDYIIEGVTGYVVPSGDSQSLRERILELWDNPAKAAEMGQAGRSHVEQNYTHVAFIRRLLRLAFILGTR